jgi:hypothetical protein
MCPALRPWRCLDARTPNERTDFAIARLSQDHRQTLYDYYYAPLSSNWLAKLLNGFQSNFQEKQEGRSSTPDPRDETRR